MGASPNLAGGLMVAGSGGGASSSTGYADALAPKLFCVGDPGDGGSCSDTCQCDPDDQASAGVQQGSDGIIAPTDLTIDRNTSVDGRWWFDLHDRLGAPVVYYPLNVGGASCLLPPDPGTSPEPVPGPGAPHSEGVQIASTGSCGPFLVGGLDITCQETGVTLTSMCGTLAVFYHNTLGTKNYNSKGGPVPNCAGHGSAHAAGSHTGTGTSSAVTISSACTP